MPGRPVRRVLFEGWLLRRSGGSIRRSNSVNPLGGRRGPADAVIDFAERFYAEFGQNAIFRVPGDRGRPRFVARGTRLCRARADADAGGRSPCVRRRRGRTASVTLAASPGRRWLEARARLAGADAVDRQTYLEMTGLIALPARFASIEEGGEIVSQAYGVVHRGVLVLESVATDPAHRRRGLGRRVVEALMGWARRQGASDAALQVLAENEPALALYRSLGFARHSLSLPLSHPAVRSGRRAVPPCPSFCRVPNRSDTRKRRGTDTCRKLRSA